MTSAPTRLHSGIPSETALRMAVVRAAHQVYDFPKALVDPLAMRIIGEEGRRRVLDPSSGHLTAGRSNTRAAAIARGRFAEDAMLAAVRDGVTQLIILGAGLDTFAYRAGLPKEVTVFELDHPATQSWKKEMLSSAGIEIPPNVKFLGFDLAAFTLFHAFQSGGFS